MESEEAIKILRKNKPTLDTRECGKELCKACDMAIEALEKQIHKEPTEAVWRTLTGQMRLCPTCRNAVSRAGRYCQNCGQRVRV